MIYACFQRQSGFFVLLLCWVVWSSAAQAKTTVVTLPQLVKQSEVIVYGHISSSAKGTSNQSPAVVQFEAESILKGQEAVAIRIITLCNQRDEYADAYDLAKLTGDFILFISRKSQCYELSHGDRSVVPVKNDRAVTIAIEDQPEDLPLGDFLHMVRLFVSSQVAAARKADSRSGPKSAQFSVFKLEFAAGAADDESLSRGIYLFRVWGDQLFLELQRITLNECSTPGNGEARFVPRVDTWETNSPLGLEAAKVSDTELEITVYQALGHGLPAKMNLTFDAQGPPFSKLVRIKTSGFIEPRYFPAQLKPIEFVPIETDRLKTLNCPILLHGLHGTDSPVAAE
jgi:hypothetical protein